MKGVGTIAILFWPLTIFIIVVFIYRIRTRNAGSQKTNYSHSNNYIIKQKDNTVYNKIYSKKKLMSDWEKSFYKLLQKNFSEYMIVPQVSLSNIVNKKKRYNTEYQNELNRIIDFGIFDFNTQKPLLLIELNDKTHKQYERRERDKRVKEILDEAGIKLITFWSDYPNEPSYVVNRIKKELR